MTSSDIASHLLQDRTITVGGAFSFPTFLGGISLAEAHEYVAFYAICVGAIGSTLVAIYTGIRIIRMLGDKSSKE